jgi:hypothetical protein
MDGDSFCAEIFAVQSRLGHVRHIASACVSDRCELVYVDAQLCHLHLGFGVEQDTKLMNKLQLL